VTVSPETPPLIFATVEEASAALRDRGMRLSTARRLVLDALFAAEGPVSAVHLAGSLAIDPTSVYRNLEVFERHGLVRHIHLGHGPGLYVLFGRHDGEYLYCERCAMVTPVAPENLDPLRAHLRDRFGYEVRFTHFALVGLCAECSEQQHQSSRGEPRAETAGDGPHPIDPIDPDRPPSDAPAHAHMHSHGDHVHSHPHTHADGAGLHRH
jgi:Fur family transcriptional regulator, ferric uptake regulator